MTAETFDASKLLTALGKEATAVNLRLAVGALDERAVIDFIELAKATCHAVLDAVEHPVVDSWEPDHALAAGASAMLAAERDAEKAQQEERRLRAGLSRPSGSPRA